jgi:hypothetical protein
MVAVTRRATLAVATGARVGGCYAATPLCACQPKGAPVSDEPVLDYLCTQFGRLNERLDKTDVKTGEIVFRLGSLERGVAEIGVQIAHLSTQLDGLEVRLTCIERRLDLVEDATP